MLRLENDLFFSSSRLCLFLRENAESFQSRRAGDVNPLIFQCEPTERLAHACPPLRRRTCPDHRDNLPINPKTGVPDNKNSANVCTFLATCPEGKRRNVSELILAIGPVIFLIRGVCTVPIRGLTSPARRNPQHTFFTTLPPNAERTSHNNRKLRQTQELLGRQPLCRRSRNCGDFNLPWVNCPPTERRTYVGEPFRRLAPLPHL